MKSLEVSEEKANQRVEEFKRQLKTLTAKLKEAENRAELAEKTVKKLQKEVDRLEGSSFSQTFTIFCLLRNNAFLIIIIIISYFNHHKIFYGYFMPLECVGEESYKKTSSGWKKIYNFSYLIFAYFYDFNFYLLLYF